METRQEGGRSLCCRMMLWMCLLSLMCLEVAAGDVRLHRAPSYFLRVEYTWLIVDRNLDT